MMKTILLAIIALAATTFASGQGKLEVKVKNIRAEKGNIRVGLFNNEKDFLQKAIEGKVIKATGTEVTVVFENLPKGDYAISVLHDENDNGEMDSNFVGIPKEGFAFGNNAMGMFGPPSFEKAKVTINEKSETQELDLKYM
jgi:uncharacterized protein (DUF2141 family)